jgi:hypothetical protein
MNEVDAIRLANLFGLDVNNAQHTLAIADALTGVDDPADFIEFCRSRKHGIEFVSKTEKLDLLAAEYKSRPSRAAKITAGEFSDRLAGKVATVRTIAKNAWREGHAAPFSSIMRDGEWYFSLKELKALAKIGSPPVIFELSERGELADEIRKEFEKAVVAAAIERKDAGALAAPAVKKF